MSSEERKITVNLITLGTGIIIFGAWTFIKFALYFLIYGAEIDDRLSDTEIILVNIFIWIFSAIVLLFYLYIGQSAQSEAKGKKKKHALYIVLIGIIISFKTVLIFGEVSLLFSDAETFFYNAITLTIDVTILVIMTELMVNAIRIRALRKKEALS